MEVIDYFNIPAFLPCAACLIIFFCSFNCLWARFFLSYSVLISFKAAVVASSAFATRRSDSVSMIASKDKFSSIRWASSCVSSLVFGRPHWSEAENAVAPTGAMLFHATRNRSNFAHGAVFLEKSVVYCPLFKSTIALVKQCHVQRLQSRYSLSRIPVHQRKAKFQRFRLEEFRIFFIVFGLSVFWETKSNMQQRGGSLTPTYVQPSSRWFLSGFPHTRVRERCQLSALYVVQVPVSHRIPSTTSPPWRWSLPPTYRLPGWTMVGPENSLIHIRVPCIPESLESRPIFAPQLPSVRSRPVLQSSDPDSEGHGKPKRLTVSHHDGLCSCYEQTKVPIRRDRERERGREKRERERENDISQKLVQHYLQYSRKILLYLMDIFARKCLSFAGMNSSSKLYLYAASSS